MLIAGWVSGAAAGSLGAGIMLGEPTGLTFKQWLQHNRALDLAAAWSFADETALDLHVDYLYHIPGPPELEVPGLLFHIGVGGRIKLVENDAGKQEEDQNRLGVRVPLGLDYLFARSHLEMFFEVAPILDLAPSTDLRVNAGLGIRYYFGARPASGR
jgi:hypothetical protein